MTPIDQTIRELCRANGDPDFKSYDTWLSHVRGALVDLNIYVFPGVVTETITANNLKNLDWPCGCVKPLLVTLIRNGCECNLYVDPGIATESPCSCSSASGYESDIYNAVSGGGDIVTDINYMDAGGYILRGRGYDKVCTHDYSRRITHLTCKVLKGDKFKFTFSTDGVSGGVTHIPPESERAVKQFSMSEYYQVRNQSLSARARNEYEKEYFRLTRLYQNFSKEDWVRAVVRR